MRILPLLAASSLLGCQSDAPNVQAKPDPPPDETVDEDGVALRQPDIEIDPPELRFGGRPPGCPSPPRTVTVRNVGNNPLAIDDLRLGGQQASAYEILGDLPEVIRAGNEATFEVVFTPQDYLDYDRARILVDSNDPDEPEATAGLAGNGADAVTTEDLFVQQQANAVDVLFVMDNSGSMAFHIRNLRNGMGTFVQNFVNLGLDYRLAITTTHFDPIGDDNDQNDPQPLPPGSIAGTEGRFVDAWMSEARDGSPTAVTNEFVRQTNLVIGDVGESANGDWEKGFDAAKAALSAPRIAQSPNQGFLRPDANLAVVVISDEPDQSSIGPQIFVNWLAGVKGGDMNMVSFSGIVRIRGNQSCGAFIPNPARAPCYHNAIDLTGGIGASIGQFDVQAFLRFLSYVAAGLEIRFPLSDQPVAATAQAIQVQVCDAQGACDPVPQSTADGWSYDAATNAIDTHGDGIPDPGETLIVTYAVAGDCPT